MSRERFRVVMITQSYYPRIGGAERQLAALAPVLQAKWGMKVHVVTRRYPGLKSFEIIGGVPVHRVGLPSPKPVAAVSFILAGLRELQRLRPHIVHAHELLAPATMAVAAKRALGVPIVATAHRGGALGDLDRIKNKPFAAWRLAALRKHVDKFVAITQEIDCELADVGIPPERRHFIPNGVDTDTFTPLPEASRRALRRRLGFTDGPIVVYAGRFTPEKRLHDLIGLWPTVREAYPDGSLVLVGAGRQEAELKPMAGAGVRFAGRVDDVLPYLRTADLFVLPSATEGLSVALLEAMAVGLPIVATAVGGAADVIVSGVNGWLTPPDDRPALQSAILALMGDAGLRADLGLRGRERVARDYALSVVAGRLRQLYAVLTSRN